MPERITDKDLEHIDLEGEGQEFPFMKKGSSHILGNQVSETSKLKVIGLASAIVFGLILIFLMFGSSGNKPGDKVSKELEELKEKLTELDGLTQRVQKLEKGIEELQKSNQETALIIGKMRKEMASIPQQRVQPDQHASVSKEGQKEDIHKTPVSKTSKETLPQFHIVQRGESLQSIAKKYNLKYQELLRINNIKDPNKVIVGQRLRLGP
ncbi:MAG: LysM peptidoglycan-binding domain-containing protein [Desulfatiglandales bacterium]